MAASDESGARGAVCNLDSIFEIYIVEYHDSVSSKS
jgi:hypothetical protein